MLVVLCLLFWINVCLGQLNPPPCQPSHQTKSNCLHHHRSCLCGWCSLPSHPELSGVGELSEHNRNHGPLGKCFAYDDDPAVNIKNCGNINATIYTHANSKYCKNVHTAIYVVAYATLAMAMMGIAGGIIAALVYWFRNYR